MNKRHHQILDILDKKVKQVRFMKTLIGVETKEAFLIDFSDYKIYKKNKLHFCNDLSDTILKKIISFLEIKETIHFRAVNKKLKSLSENHLNELSELGIFMYETIKVIIIYQCFYSSNQSFEIYFQTNNILKIGC